MALNNVVYMLLAFLGILKYPNTNLNASHDYDWRCSLTVINGVAMCHDVGSEENACKVFCDGKNKGTFRCTKGRGWDKELPYCVSDLKDYSRWCSVSVKEGTIGCQIEEGEVRCNVICKRNQTESGAVYRCLRDQGWDKKFPHCVSDLKEKSPCGLIVKNGSAVCQDSGPGQISCSLLCDGKPHGLYSCSQEEGWNKELPHCVADPHDYFRCGLTVKNGAVVCEKGGHGGLDCHVICDGKDQGSYRCSQQTGWNKKLPYCVAHLRAPEKLTSEVTSCDPDKCGTECGYVQLGGNCVDGVCKCENPAAEKISAEATGCDEKSCVSDCSSHNLQGKCEDGKCRCTWS